MALGLFAAGTFGRMLGYEERRERRGRDRGVEQDGLQDEQRPHAAQERAAARSTESARIAAPAGSVAPPVSITTPYW